VAGSGGAGSTLVDVGAALLDERVRVGDKAVLSVSRGSRQRRKCLSNENFSARYCLRHPGLARTSTRASAAPRA
jgi:hypothetical protein